MGDEVVLTSDALTTAKGTLQALAAKPLGQGFKFFAFPMDAFLIYLQVEPLLEQAGVLIDRCLVDRNESRNYEAELWRLRQELDEFFDLHQIRLDEISANTDRQAIVALTADKNANNELAIGYQAAADELEALLSSVESPADQALQARLRAQQALISRLPYDKKTYTDVNPLTWTVDYNDGKGPQALTLADQSSVLADALARRDIQSRHANARAQWAVYQRTALAYHARARAAENQLLLAIDDVNFKRKRSLLAATHSLARLDVLDQTGHPLNYRARIEAVRVRFERDLRDAWARIMAAAHGLDQLFGYAEPLPAHDDLDGIVLWLRDAMSWLSTFQRRDQNYVVSVSVRQSLGAADWAAGVAAGRWRLPIPESLSPGEFHVRSRGVGATVVGGSAEDLWNVSIRAPRNADIVHGDGRRVTLDQNLLGAVRLGRVTVRTDRSLDVGGVAMLHNASPFGTWEIALSPTSTAGAQRGILEDVVLDLFMAARIP